MNRSAICRKRIISSMLTAAMLATMLPFSAAAEAVQALTEGEPDIYVHWEPQGSAEGQNTKTVTLSAGIAETSNVQSATVEITLTAEEKAALTDPLPEGLAWKEESSPGEQEGTDETGTDSTEQNPATTPETSPAEDEQDESADSSDQEAIPPTEGSGTESTGTSGEIQQPGTTDENGSGNPDATQNAEETTSVQAGDASLPEMPQATSAEPKHYILTFTLTKTTDQPAPALTQGLTFILPEDLDTLSVEVTNDDITVGFLPDENADSFTTDIQTSSFTLTGESETDPVEPPAEEQPEETEPAEDPTISSDGNGTMTVNGGLSNFSFSLTLPDAGDTDRTYHFDLALPDGVSLPEGEMHFDNGTMLSGETTAATFTGLPDGAAVTNIESSTNALTFDLTFSAAESVSGETGEGNTSGSDDASETTGESGDTPSAADGEETAEPDNSADNTSEQTQQSPSLLSGLISRITTLFTGGEQSPAPNNVACAIAFTGSIFMVSDTLFASPGEKQITLTVTADNEGFTPLASSITLTAPQNEQQNYEVTDTTNETQSVYWCDNNQTSLRPSFGTEEGELYPVLKYTITDENENAITTDDILTEDILRSWGCVDEDGNVTWPEISVSGNTLTVSGLPSELTDSDPYNPNTYAVTWTIEPPATVPEGYTLVEITDENIGDYPSAEGNYGWYYILTDDFTFTLDLRNGDDPNPTKEQVLALLKQFEFHWQYGTTKKFSTFDALVETGHFTYDPETGEVTISGIWVYNVDGSPITYWVEEKGTEEEAPGTIIGDELKETDAADLLGEGDWLTISYSNTDVPNAGTITDQVRNGGQLSLTLSGTAEYNATKVWLDEEDENARPTATFTLWRYRSGESYNTAAPVRDTNNRQLTLDSNNLTPNEDGSYSINFDEQLKELGLPKYDSEGYEYIYCVREELSYETGNNRYEQVFGKVDADTGEESETMPEGYVGADGTESTTRASGDTYLYNEGTLSNRLTGTVETSVTKNWNAAAFQADFEDVAVEFTLKQRAKTEDGTEDWVDSTNADGEKITYVMFDFYAEHMSDTHTASMPQYDALGRELEYQWVETAIYQDESIAALPSNATQDDVKEVIKGLTSLLGENGDFTLQQSREGETTAQSVSYVSEEKRDGNATTVTNTLSDTIDYAVKKTWKEPEDAHEITINIYQVQSGQSLDFTTTPTPFVSFTIDDEGNVKSSEKLPDGVTLENDNSQFDHNHDSESTESTWDAILENLPKYDAEGHLYEYVLLEGSGGTSGYPTYVTERYEDGCYSTEVINGPGDGERIMVQKVWMDDGDDLHREPVTFTVHWKENSGNTDGEDSHKAGDPVKYENGDIVTLTLQNGVWYDFIGLPADVSAEDVYVVETSMGTGEEGDQTYHKVAYTVNNESGESQEDHSYERLYPKPGNETTDTGTSTNNSPLIFVETDNHRYQVTYQETEGTTIPGADALFTVTNRRLGNIDLTVEKEWLAGDDKSEGDVKNQILDQLKLISEGDITGKEKANLALVFKLKFADKEYAATQGWKITYSGIDQSDTVTVGGEAVPIYSKSNEDTEIGASSEQVILGILSDDDNGQDNSKASFLGLPKYASNGQVVQYTVEEVWVEIVESQDGTTTSVEVTDLSQYSDKLAELWSQFTQSYSWTYHQNVTDEGEASNLHDLDEQSLTVTNTRSDTVDIEWHKEWRDAFANDNNLRPDIYLDIYRVVHVGDEDSGNGYKEQIELVQENYKWTADSTQSEVQTLTIPAVTPPADDNGVSALSADGGGEAATVEVQATTRANRTNDVWTVTLEGMPKYDTFGFEIQYYAVERTVVHASDYDYQAVQYASSDTNNIVGNRDGVVYENKNDTFGQITLDLDTDATDYVGEAEWANSDDMPDGIGNYDGSSGEGNTYPRYALLSDNTFVNTLSNSYTINGQKLWNLPPSGYSDEELPSVTFSVYRYSADEIPEFDDDSGELIVSGKDAIATLTIESGVWQYLKNGDSYGFEITHEGNTKIVLGENGDYKYRHEPNAAELPLYDPATGERYTYYVVESMSFGNETGEGGTAPDPEQVYDIIQPGESSDFTFINTYDPVEGAIKVKKILSLPAGVSDITGGFPEITFTLTRSYTDNKGVVAVDTQFSESVKISSDEVWQAYQKANSAPFARHIFEISKTVSGLDIYAPNGSKYIYTVTEAELGGYKMYAMPGDKEQSDFNGGGSEETKVEDIIPVEPEEGQTEPKDAQATFYNVRPDEPDEQSDIITLQGTKRWNDLNNSLNTRPGMPTDVIDSETGKNPLGLTVSRSAGANSAAQPLTIGQDYKIQYTKVNNNTWTFTIEGMDDTELEKWATNGQPWTYTVKETLDENGRLKGTYYVPEDNKYTWQADADGAKVEGGDAVDLGTVTNSIIISAKFAKEWKDGNDQLITEDYLGFDLTVTFKLQVKPENGEWQDASKYFVGNKGITITHPSGWTSVESDQFLVSKSGRVNAGDWSGSFGNLPTVVQEDEKTVELQYRVVETTVAYPADGTPINTQTFEPGTEAADGSFTYTKPEGSPANGLVTEATYRKDDATHVTTNKLSTTSLTVEKEWEDNNNQYNSRPNPAEGSQSMTWEAWFVVQRTTSGASASEADWKNIKVIRLFGGNAGSEAEDTTTGHHWSETVSGLPTADFQNGGTYTYRVRELQPKAGGYDMGDSDIADKIVGDGGTFMSGNNDYTTTYDPQGGIPNGTRDNTVTVTNTLITEPPTEEETENIQAVKVWYTDPNGGNTWPDDVTVTLVLQRSTDQTSWTDVADQLKTLSGDSPTAEWNELPSKQDGKDLYYRVVEQTPDGYIQLPVQETTTGDITVFTFTNVAPTSFTVEKKMEQR